MIRHNRIKNFALNNLRLHFKEVIINAKLFLKILLFSINFKKFVSANLSRNQSQSTV